MAREMVVLKTHTFVSNHEVEIDNIKFAFITCMYKFNGHLLYYYKF